MIASNKPNSSLKYVLFLSKPESMNLRYEIKNIKRKLDFKERKGKKPRGDRGIERE